MAWPTDQVVVGDLITAAQLNRIALQLANETLTGADADLDFTSIPAHWSHLVLKVSGQNDGAGESNTRLRFNGDTGANYDWQQVQGVAAAASAGESIADSFINIGNTPAATAGYLGQMYVVIFDYASTTLHKGIIAVSGRKQGTASGNLTVRATVGWWRNAAAINRITVSPAAGNLTAGSRATLEGGGRI